MNDNFDNFDPNAAMQSSNPGSVSPERDRFELLSAYLDGEVTADERRQVEGWLSSDPKFANMHRRLMTLRQGFQSMPIPAASLPVDKTIAQVFEKVERRSRFRLIAGGAIAVAAATVAVMGGFNQSPSLQVATTNRPVELEATQAPVAATNTNLTNGLMVNLDEPVLVIAKTTTDDVSPARKSIGVKGSNAIEQ
jgi:anti-sigma factor RsiW